ncbi:MAG: hypothetical protein AAF717_05180 [Bacteroidota bacterium]
MRKFVVFLAAFMLLSGCKNEGEQEGNSEQAAEDFSFRNMPKGVPIQQEALQILEDWQEYKGLEESFSVLKRASNTEDLELAIDDLIEKEAILAKGEYPVPFDQLQFKSRQRVLRTFLLKIKGNLEDRQDVEQAVVQMLEAYNAMKMQFNILTSSTLDKKLILDEE